MHYGDNGYKTIDALQRVGDFFRAGVSGRYKIKNDDGILSVTKRYPFSFKDKSLEMSDFNNRLVRGLETNIRKSNEPVKSLYFNVGTQKRREAAIDFVNRHDGPPLGEANRQARKAKNWIGYGLPVALLGGMFYGATDVINFSNPESFETAKIVLNGISEAALLGGLFGSGKGSYHAGRAANIKRHDVVQKELKGLPINF